MDYPIDAGLPDGARHLEVRIAFMDRLCEDTEVDKVIRKWAADTGVEAVALQTMEDLDGIAREVGYTDRRALWQALKDGEEVCTRFELLEQFKSVSMTFLRQPLPEPDRLHSDLRRLFDGWSPKPWPWFALNFLERLVGDHFALVVGNDILRSQGLGYFRPAPNICIRSRKGESREQLAARLDEKAAELRSYRGRLPSDRSTLRQSGEWLYEHLVLGRSQYSIAKALHADCRAAQEDEPPCERCKRKVSRGIREARRLMDLAA